MWPRWSITQTDWDFKKTFQTVPLSHYWNNALTLPQRLESWLACRMCFIYRLQTENRGSIFWGGPDVLKEWKSVECICWQALPGEFGMSCGFRSSSVVSAELDVDVQVSSTVRCHENKEIFRASIACRASTATSVYERDEKTNVSCFKCCIGRLHQHFEYDFLATGKTQKPWKHCSIDASIHSQVVSSVI